MSVCRGLTDLWGWKDAVRGLTQIASDGLQGITLLCDASGSFSSALPWRWHGAICVKTRMPFLYWDRSVSPPMRNKHHSVIMIWVLQVCLAPQCKTQYFSCLALPCNSESRFFHNNIHRPYKSLAYVYGPVWPPPQCDRIGKLYISESTQSYGELTGKYVTQASCFFCKTQTLQITALGVLN